MGAPVSARVLLLSVALACSACGFGFHSNSTVARTPPYHAHLDDLAGYPELADDAPVALPAGAAVVPVFVPYYALPASFVVLAEGFSRGTSWAALPLPAPPEKGVAAELSRALGAQSDAPLRVDGVVTDFEFYDFRRGKEGRGGQMLAGRVASRLVVTRKDGTVVFEGELATEGRVGTPAALYRAHVTAWSRHEGLRKALSGG